MNYEIMMKGDLKMTEELKGTVRDGTDFIGNDKAAANKCGIIYLGKDIGLMDQVKTGAFIKKLRTEKGLTQEQLAEKFNVSRRTVSRWETGSNMPDLDVLIEMSDYFDVDIRELLDGERKDRKMDKELEETVLMVADYSSNEKKRIKRIMCSYFIAGTTALLTNGILDFCDLPETFWIGFAKGSTFGLALVAMLLGLAYASGHLARFIAINRR